MKSYFEKDDVMSPNKAEKTTPRTWYLHHFGVKNPCKSHKLRISHTAAEAVNGVSLNTMLLAGS